MRVGWIVTSGILILVWLARGLLLPILLAAMLAYLLGPAITWADTLAIRRTVAVAMLYLVIITVLVVAGYLLGHGFGYGTLFVLVGTFHLIGFLAIMLFAGRIHPLRTNDLLEIESIA